MALGRRGSERQEPLWVEAGRIVRGPGSPFYAGMNAVLAEAGFDRWVEGLCERFYADGRGRPGVPPGVYFRMLMVGYLEGLDSERGIAWRCADSLSLREFLGYPLTEKTPDHSTLSVIRGRIDVETHQEVFCRILALLTERGLLKGKTIGVDATTLEANAAIRNIVRRDTGEDYRRFLERLAKESGVDTPTREQLVKLDRTRKNKASNQDWEHPHDPDARITKMKDGRTRMGHKAEHAVDMRTGAIVAVTVQPADRGDTSSLGRTLCEAIENLSAAGVGPIEDAVMDKGYHSNDTLVDLEQMEIRGYVSEPDRGRRRWDGREQEQRAVHGNRRRIRRRRGKGLLRRRGELLERSFAHCYGTGAMRRTHLRGHEKIHKRQLIHAAAANMGLLMRTLLGAGTPRGLAERRGVIEELNGAGAALHRAAPKTAAAFRTAAAALTDRLAARISGYARTFALSMSPPTPPQIVRPAA